MSRPLGWMIAVLFASIVFLQFVVVPPYVTCETFVASGPHKNCSVYEGMPSRGERWGWW